MAADPYFSFVVPAHTEEAYLGETLRHLASLDYPKELYEVIVIENGSVDATLAVAQEYVSDSIRVYSYRESGVSFARNRGIEHTNPSADWILFLDADTLVPPTFLRELAETLSGQTDVVSGTTRVRPISGIRIARFWYLVYDVVHALFRNSWSFFYVRSDVARSLRFNEDLVLMEDAQYLYATRKFGRFYFAPHCYVEASTRRFDKDGWLRPILLYTFVGLLPASLQAKFEYTIKR